MKTVAIMQPYLFPYVGYFHLIAAVDEFVFFDDVQYIERGWSNRNRILIAGKPHTITLPVRGGPRSATYSAREYCLDQIERCINRPIRFHYAKAPYFSAVMPMLEDALSFPNSNVAKFNGNLLRKVSRFLGIPTEFRYASELGIDDCLRNQDRVIAVAVALNAKRYINAAGGIALYSPPAFDKAGLELRFIKSTLAPYRQFSGDPVVGLSIIDVLMFNSVDKIRENLWSWTIIPSPSRSSSQEQQYHQPILQKH